jgi:predicted GTPase
LNWRKNKTVIHTGKLTHYLPDNNVYVYFRHNDTETVMVVINNAPDTQKINLTRFQENIKTFVSGTDVLEGKTIDLKNELSIEGKTALILELK